MSLALNKMEVIGVNLPVLDINQKPEYAVIHSGNYVQYKQYQSTSYSNNSFQFSCPPPSEKILVDRKILLRTPVTFEITGTVVEGGTQVQWNPGYDGFRSYPLSSNMQTMQVTINNSTATIQMSDVIQSLLRYHNPENLKNSEYSMTPSELDNCQNYADLTATNRNVLGTFGDSDSVVHRGAFPYSLTFSAATATTKVIVNTVFSEYLYLSPLYFGFGDAKGLYGVRTFDCNFTWNSNLSRMLCHVPADQSGNASSTWTNVNVTFGQPQLLFQYVTPPLTMIRNPSISYPYYIVNRFPTGPSTLNSGATITLSSNNIQLNSIPRRMYIFARQQNSDQTYSTTDTFAAISNISIQFENFSGLLASASQIDLYNISKTNGCNLSFTEWSGGLTSGVTASSGGDPVISQGLLNGQLSYAEPALNTFGSTGSVLCICPGKDIGLPDNLASGVVGQFMFQFNITLTNPNVGQYAPANINYMLYLITVDEGIWTIENGSSIAQGQGVVSQMDVLDARSKPFVSYDDVAYAQGSGKFFSNLKHHMRRRIHRVIDDHKNKDGGIDVGGVAVGGDNGGVLLGGSLNNENRIHDNGSYSNTASREKKIKEQKYLTKELNNQIGGKLITAQQFKDKLKKYI